MLREVRVTVLSEGTTDNIEVSAVDSDTVYVEIGGAGSQVRADELREALSYVLGDSLGGRS